MSILLYLKAIHIIFVVTWFAGLFYITRLFIYQTEAQDREDPAVRKALTAQFKLMSKRLWFGITWPSAIITLIMGASLVFEPARRYYEDMPGWLWIKLGFVLGLFAYHLSLHSIYKNLQQDRYRRSGQQLRMWNEVATIFLIAIVFLVVLKNALDMLVALVGLFVLIAGLLVAIRLYRKARQRRQEKQA